MGFSATLIICSIHREKIQRKYFFDSNPTINCLQAGVFIAKLNLIETFLDFLIIQKSTKIFLVSIY